MAEITPMRSFGSCQYWPAVLTLVGALLASPTVQAEEEHNDSHHAYHKNTIGVFFGITGI